MKMKQIHGATIQDALAIARRELGEDAVLLETKKNAKGQGVVVTFAVDAPDEVLFEEEPLFDAASIQPFTPAITRPATAKLEIKHPALALIAEALEYHHVPPALAQRLLNTLHKIRLKPDALIEVAQVALADALAENIAFQPMSTGIRVLPNRALMLIGPHGAGKTSTIAKLATELTLHKQRVVLVSTDMERMGGTESLGKLAEILACEFHTCESRAELKALLPNYLGRAWVLVDTAGANIYEFAQMRALGELASLQGVEPILTCPAGMDADEAQEMAGVFDFLTIERMIVTRLDAVRRLKSVFAVLTTGGYALSNLSNSAVPTDACQPLSPIALSRLMLRHVRERLTQ